MHKIKIKKHIISGLIFCALIIGSLGINLALAQSPEIYPSVIDIKGTTGDQINYLRRLPGGDWKGILANIIKLILQITGSLTVISFTVGGVMMITSQGNEEKTTKGKNILLWSVLALIIIAVSYAIVLGITQLQLI